MEFVHLGSPALALEAQSLSRGTSMTDKRLVDFDHMTGVKEEYAYEDGKAHLLYTHDVSAIIEHNKRLRESTPNFKGGFVVKASLSFVQCMELQKIGIMDKGFTIRDEAAFDVWLSNHPYMKGTEGKV